MKSGIKIVVTLLVLTGLWAGLRQIDWRSIFKVEQRMENLEEDLGKVYMRFLRETELEYRNQKMLGTLEKLITKITRNETRRSKRIRIHVFLSSEVNAFTLPDGHIVVFSGLIESCRSSDELAAVLAHEIAHHEKEHVMQALVREFGIATLSNLVSNGGGTLIAESLENLTSLAFSRDLEKEADLVAVDYLQRAQINPQSLADFLERMEGVPEFAEWFSSHPLSEERAAYIREKISEQNNTSLPYLPAMEQDEWKLLQKAMED